jgi:hypothetical protein
VILLQNNSPWGDYFKVNLLGIPLSWITYSGPQSVWVAEGGQEKIILNVNPPGIGEGISGRYPARLYIFGQSAPENVKELELLLTVLPAEKTKQAFQLRVDTNEIMATPGTEAKIPVVISNLTEEAESLELFVQGVPANWVVLPSPVINLLPREEKRVVLILRIPTTPAIRSGYIPVKISAASQKNPTGPGTNLLTQEINEYLPIKFIMQSSPQGFLLGGLSSIKNGQIYTSDVSGLVAKIVNPWDSSKRIVVLAGNKAVGTKACVIALTNLWKKTLDKYKGEDTFAVVITGFDLDGDGKVDSIEVRE